MRFGDAAAECLVKRVVYGRTYSTSHPSPMNITRSQKAVLSSSHWLFTQVLSQFEFLV